MLIKKPKLPIKEIILYGFLPSSLKKIIYLIKGYKIGKGVKFGFGSVIIGKNVKISDYSEFGFFCIVRAKKINIARYVKIGSMTIIDTERISIDEDSKINELVMIGGLNSPDSALEIGKRVIIMEYSFINPTKPIKIGDDSGIGGHCLLFTHGSWSSQLEGFPVTFKPITIGKRVWLPWRVFLMPGTNIGDDVVIGANSLISSEIPSNSLAIGSPAKVVKSNYPTKLNNIEKNTLVDSIIKDFIEYMRHHHFDCKKSQNHTFVSNNKYKSEFYIYNKSSNFKFMSEDNLLILAPGYREKPKINNKMIIDLEQYERSGSSLIGEEMVKFFSRYGIRFNRTD